jgi:hypothetical protein
LQQFSKKTDKTWDFSHRNGASLGGWWRDRRMLTRQRCIGSGWQAGATCQNQKMHQIKRGGFGPSRGFEPRISPGKIEGTNQLS